MTYRIKRKGKLSDIVGLLKEKLSDTNIIISSYLNTLLFST